MPSSSHKVPSSSHEAPPGSYEVPWGSYEVHEVPCVAHEVHLAPMSPMQLPEVPLSSHELPSGSHGALHDSHGAGTAWEPYGSHVVPLRSRVECMGGTWSHTGAPGTTASGSDSEGSLWLHSGKGTPVCQRLICTIVLSRSSLCVMYHL
jgi:hypothetical protein